ncbi:MAG: shikimate kinase [Calditrichales bacterium]|nr:shikimate kinase [Calditrichales bacterium]
MKKHIFLTGFMGAGKSKIGSLLAGEISHPFVDSDKMIERETGKTVRQIFEEDGEESFRKMESEVIRSLADCESPSVIALGGGALTNKKNFDLVTKNGILIYIKSLPEAIYERIKDSKKRPLLNVPEGEKFKENMLFKINGLLNKRTAVYEQADVIIERDSLSLEEILKTLIKNIAMQID